MPSTDRSLDKPVVNSNQAVLWAALIANLRRRLISQKTPPV